MDKETQDKAWACLPEEARMRINFLYIMLLSNGNAEYGIAPSELLRAAKELDEAFDSTNILSPSIWHLPEMLCVERSKVTEVYAYNEDILKTNPTHGGARLLKAKLQELFGDKCLPDNVDSLADNVDSSEPNVESKPRFKEGDVVRVVTGKFKGEVCEIYCIDETDDEVPYLTSLWDEDDETSVWLSDSDLEPYTEPEPTKDNMEEKELNLCELLRKYGADKIYLVDEGEVELVEIIDKFTVDVKGVDGRPIGLRGETLEIKPTGFAYIYPSKEAFLKYPLEAAKAWEIWAESCKPKRWRAKDGEYYYRFDAMFSCVKEMENGGSTDNTYYGHGNYFQTREECFKAAEAVKRTLEQFHEQHPQE